ncbi:type I restriction enzyme, S subunit [Pseudoalteromonas sp. BSi20311]|uniref:restriction endonuclease subunit S n=1 Tax=Pseudoalteromonas sp. BSi20311 TaxID=383911 RepID=UPI0002319761|nr:restriction endonuclease subunit S [Pseudoalteromonas sp. BSi20311]GAA64262.1 type I restriction enzyme, S subunit [Pseudoalteromonas sp. BSi20311]
MSVIEQVVPEGYKQTDVGIIPIDWKVSKLGNIGKFKNGINKDADSFGHGLPFINLMDVFGKPHISGNENLGLINSTEIERKEYNVKKSDVLFIRSSVKPTGVGLTSVALQDLRDSVYSGFLIRYRSNDDLTTDFKRHCFYDSGFRNRLIAASTVSANTNINQDALKELQVAYPSNTEEQTAIANALSDVDALLTELEKLIAKKQAIKTATMQQLLTGKTRLPQFAFYSKESAEVATYTEGAVEGKSQGQPKGTKPSELGEIPEDWDVILLNDISVISRLAGAEYTSFWKEEPTGEIIALRGFNIGQNKIINRELTRISNSLSMKLKRSRLTKGDVIYPCVGSIGNAAVIHDDKKYHIQQNIARITPSKSKLNSEFLCFYLMSELATKEVERFTATTSQPSVLVSSLRQYRLPIPKCIEEQTAIATILSDMDNEIQTLEQRLTKTRQIKQGMMQQLLTGRTRLPFNKE